MADDDLTKRDKINILLKEYDALRAEVLTRSNQQFTLLTIAAAALAWLLTRKPDWVFWLLLAALAFAFTNNYWISAVFIWRIGHRMKEIERRVNEIAGETLLRWETHWGGATHGSYRIVPPGAPVASTPPERPASTT